MNIYFVRKTVFLFVLGVFFGLLIAVLGLAINTQNIGWNDMSALENRLLGPLLADDPAMLSILRDRYLLPPDTQPYNISSNNAVYNKDNTYYGIGILKSLQEVFSHIHNGFFVEAGALDGVYLSNTLWLEQQRGWTGLLIEPNIVSYRELLTKHRKAWVSNTCLSFTQFPRQTVLVSLLPIRNARPKMNIKGTSYEYGIDLEMSKDQFLKKNLDNFLNLATKHHTNVQCFPLGSYLLTLNVSTVDFLSLDIQGSEKAVLDTLPWETVNFRALLVETTKAETDQDFLDVMANRGYKNLYISADDILFIKKGDPLLDVKHN